MTSFQSVCSIFQTLLMHQHIFEENNYTLVKVDGQLPKVFLVRALINQYMGVASHRSFPFGIRSKKTSQWNVLANPKNQPTNPKPGTLAAYFKDFGGWWDASRKLTWQWQSHPFFKGDASSNGCYLAIVMLAFRGVHSYTILKVGRLMPGSILFRLVASGTVIRGAWKRTKVGHGSQTNYENNSNPNWGWLKFPTKKEIDLVKTCLFSMVDLDFQGSSYIIYNFQIRSPQWWYQVHSSKTKKHAELQQNSVSKKVNITPPNRPPPPSGKPDFFRCYVSFRERNKKNNERETRPKIHRPSFPSSPSLSSVSWVSSPIGSKIKKSVGQQCLGCMGEKGSYKSSGTYTNKVRSMSIVYFSSGEGNSITDLSQDTGGNRLMRMMIMIMMMCCDWHCSHSFSVKKKQHVCRDAKHILNHNLFAGDPNLFWSVGLEFKQRKSKQKKDWF